MRRVAASLLTYVGWFGLAAGSASAASVAVDPDETFLVTIASDGAGDDDFEFSSPEALPYLQVVSTLDGQAAAETTFELTDSGFQITFEHARPGAFESYTSSYGTIVFQVDQDVEFVASGSYSAIDPAGSSTSLGSTLSDLSLQVDLYDSAQDSESTPNESFTLGSTAGDFFNRRTGSLTGTLIAGHDYQFDYGAALAAPEATSAASATGFVFLSFVPEPAPGSGGACVLATLAFLATRRGGRGRPSKKARSR